MSVAISTLNKADSAPLAERVAPYHHLCLLYQTQEEQLQTIVHLMHTCLERNEKWICLADQPESLLGALQASGIDIDAMRRAGTLAIMPSSNAFWGDHCSTPESTPDFITEAAQQAKIDGFSALRVVWEMGQAQNGPIIESLLACETQLNKILPALDVWVICQYNRQQLGPDVILDIIHAHPFILMDGVECKNPYYVPPEQLPRPEQSAAEVKRLLTNIREQAWNAPQRQAEIETEAVSVLSQLFLSFETLEDVYRNLPAMLSAYFQFSIAAIVLYDRATQEMAVEGTHGIWHDREKPIRLPITQTISGTVVTTQKAMMRSDISHIRDRRFRPLQKLGVRFFLCVPMQVGGHVLGALWLADYESPKSPIPHIETFMIIANHLAQEIDRKQAAEALRESEERYRLITEHMTDTVWLMDTDLSITFISPSVTRTRGYSLEELRSMPLEKHLTPASLEIVAKALAAEGQPEKLANKDSRLSWTMELEFCRKDGSTIWNEVTISLIRDKDGNPSRLLGVGRDISERKIAEAAEREQRTLAEALRDTTIALNSTLSLDEVLDRILANVGRVVPHDTASIMLIEDGIARVAKARGFAERGLEGWFVAQRFPICEVPTMHQMFQTKQPVLIPDTQVDTLWIGYPETSWIRSYIGAPIIIDGQVIGIIHLDNAKSGAFTANHAERLRAFAEHAAVAIHNAQLYEAEHYERIVAETLHEIAEVMASSAPLERILDLSIARLEQILQCDWTAIMLVQSDFLHVIVAHGFPDQANILEKVYHYPKIPLFYEALAQGEPIAISNAQEDPRWVPLPGLDGPVGGWIGMPIVIRDVVIGLLTAGGVQPYKYTERDLKTVMAFAQHAALAFETTQVYSELESSLSDVRNLKAHMARTAQLHVAGEIATGIAHQVNNPLTTIIAETHLLLKQLPPSSTYYESAESIREAAYRAGTVVQRLLNFARVHLYSLETLDINLSIERAISLVRAQIEPHIARVVLDLAPNLPLVEASGEHLEDVWINLLLNARDAIHRPGVGVITIATKLDTHDRMIEIRIQDNGIGIPTDQFERIFAPFHTTKEHGTGLGLPICRDVVTRHGGTIRVESEVGRGTTFVVSLPPGKKLGLTPLLR